MAFHGLYIGSDEAGKGDFFGPLVVAAVAVDEQTLEILRAIGVKDSKTLIKRGLFHPFINAPREKSQRVPLRI